MLKEEKNNATTTKVRSRRRKNVSKSGALGLVSYQTHISNPPVPASTHVIPFIRFDRTHTRAVHAPPPHLPPKPPPSHHHGPKDDENNPPTPQMNIKLDDDAASKLAHRRPPS
ncbi:jg9886 [Pararge aegeria aegeria]|uniref:Jg9886 protein n=1 Tax=Pararge aegeria aegeria TaxID=348720 RepID=A0A8S4REX1_9NEOP|nr:jg9886 [Pararge aegeria aegeria]